MTVQSNGVDITRPAGADLTAAQFRFVKVNSSGQVVVAGAGEAAIGVLQNNPGSGQAATVRVGGTTKVKAGGTIAAGADVASNASGAAIAATPGRTNTSDAGGAADPLIGSHVIGVALDGGVANDVIQLLLLHKGAVPTTAA